MIQQGNEVMKIESNCRFEIPIKREEQQDEEGSRKKSNKKNKGQAARESIDDMKVPDGTQLTIELATQLNNEPIIHLLEMMDADRPSDLRLRFNEEESIAEVRNQVMVILDKISKKQEQTQKNIKMPIRELQTFVPMLYDYPSFTQFH